MTTYTINLTRREIDFLQEAVHAYALEVADSLAEYKNLAEGIQGPQINDAPHGFDSYSRNLYDKLDTAETLKHNIYRTRFGTDAALPYNLKTFIT